MSAIHWFNWNAAGAVFGVAAPPNGKFDKKQPHLVERTSPLLRYRSRDPGDPKDGRTPREQVNWRGLTHVIASRK
jgi:hypothetical protein